MATISKQINDDQISLFLSGRLEFPFRKASAIEQIKQSNPQKDVRKTEPLWYPATTPFRHNRNSFSLKRGTVFQE